MLITFDLFFSLKPVLKWVQSVFVCPQGDGGGATWTLPSNGDAKELRQDPTVGLRPKVWTRDQRWNKYCL